MCSSTLSLISALGEGGRSTPRPVRFIPGKDPVPAVIVVSTFSVTRLSNTVLFLNYDTLAFSERYDVLY